MANYFASLDGDGFPIAFYSDAFFPPQADGSANGAIPASAVSITAQVYVDCISNSGLRRIVDGACVPYVPPPAAAIVPRLISRRQFATQLAIDADITQGEALAWLGGTLPNVFTSAITKLDATQQFPAQMALFADSFDRRSSWTALLGSVLNKSDADLDAIWTAAAALA